MKTPSKWTSSLSASLAVTPDFARRLLLRAYPQRLDEPIAVTMAREVERALDALEIVQAVEALRDNLMRGDGLPEYAAIRREVAGRLDALLRPASRFADGTAPGTSTVAEAKGAGR